MSVRVRFQVRLPAGTPPGQVFLTGTPRAWSDDPRGWTFDAGDRLDADFPPGTLASLKVRLLRHDGTVTEEGDPWGGRAPAHKLVIQGDHMQADRTVTLTVAGWQDGRGGAGRPMTAAPPREEWTLAAPWGEQRVRLWWPAGTRATDLPRLLLHDGQNVFDEGPTFAGQSWHAADAAQAAADTGHPCLLVGLSVNEERSRRYLPFAVHLNGHRPGADEYLNWIARTLMPALDRRFGTVGAGRTALAGSSFGGHVTLYGGLRDPGRYGTLGVFSPSLWPADHALPRWVAARADPAACVWLDAGDHEGDTLTDSARSVQDVRQLGEALHGRVREVHFSVGAGHWHDETAWKERFPAFLAWWLGGLPG